jgi:hypothetical protein
MTPDARTTAELLPENLLSPGELRLERAQPLECSAVGELSR